MTSPSICALDKMVNDFYISVNKYYISEEVWPWSTYPGYLFGGAYLVGRDAIRLLLAAAQTTPYFIFEDVYITGICTKKTNVNIYVSEL